MGLRTSIVLSVLMLAGCGPASAPSLPRSPAAAPPASEAVAPPASLSPAPVRHAFPVAGHASYEHTHHGYPATDIFAACGTPYVAPVDGVVLELSRVDHWDAKVNDGATRGGLNISILGDDGIRYYAAHFASIEPSVAPQSRVSAGQKLAVVGRTGDTTVCHVHFGISPLCTRLGDWWIRRGVIWPWPYLDSWRAGEARTPVPEIEAWQATNGCPVAPLVEP